MGKQKLLQHRRKFFFPIVLGVLLLVAIGMNGYLFLSYPCFLWDAPEYVFSMQNFMQGEGYIQNILRNGNVVFWPPAYGLCTFLFFQVTGNFETAAMLVSSCSYISIILLSYCIGRMLGGGYGAFLSAFFVTFCPLIVAFSYLPFTEKMYIACMLAVVLIYIRLLLFRVNYRQSLLLGILTGFLVWIRDEGLFIYLAVMVFWALYTAFKQRKKGLRHLGRAFSYPALAACIGACLIAVPAYHLYRHTGSFAITGKIYYWFPKKSAPPPAAPKASAEGDHRESERAKSPEKPWYETRTVKYIQKRLEKASDGVVPSLKIWLNITLHVLLPGSIIMGIGGVYFMRIDTRRRLCKEKLFLLCAVSLIFMALAGIPLFFYWSGIHSRYFLPPAVFFIVLMAASIGKILQQLPQKFSIVGGIAVCVFSFFIATGGLEDTRIIRNRSFASMFSISRETISRLIDYGMPEELAKQLKPLKGRVYIGNTGKENLIQDVTSIIGTETAVLYDDMILQESFKSLPFLYANLLEVLSPPKLYVSFYDKFRAEVPGCVNPRLCAGLRAAGEWLRRVGSSQNDMAAVKIISKRSDIILAYANGMQEEPEPERAVWLPSSDIESIITLMKQQHIQYLILHPLTWNIRDMRKLWDNPNIFHQYGLERIYHDPDGLFQVYALAGEET